MAEIGVGDSLGDVEQLVLLAMLHLGEESYGVAVQREIRHRTRRSVSLGSVYTALTRLEHKGMISSRWGEPTAERGGRRKRNYQILAPGRRALMATLRRLRQMTRGLNQSWQLP